MSSTILSEEVLEQEAEKGIIRCPQCFARDSLMQLSAVAARCCKCTHTFVLDTLEVRGFYPISKAMLKRLGSEFLED